MAIATRFQSKSTKNVRTDGLPEPQNDVAGSYTDVPTAPDYGSWEPQQDVSGAQGGGTYRRALYLKVVRTGDQKS
jgi:hypothetical protein